MVETMSPGDGVSTKYGYLSKHPCTGCGTGYGECAQGLAVNLLCCRACGHPTRWQPEPWTVEDLAEIAAEFIRQGRSPEWPHARSRSSSEVPQ